MDQINNDLASKITEDLRKKYNKSVISKQELASEIDISISTLNNYMSKGYGIPRYKKIGGAKNAKVVFPILEVANFLAQIVEVDYGL